MPSLREEMISKGLIKPKDAVSSEDSVIKKILEKAFLSFLTNEPPSTDREKKQQKPLKKKPKNKDNNQCTKPAAKKAVKNLLHNKTVATKENSQTTKPAGTKPKKKSKYRINTTQPLSESEIKKIQRAVFQHKPTICVICGQAVGHGKMLEHKRDAHSEKMYIQSEPKPNSSKIYAHIVQGGLPSLGKRSR